MKYLLILFTCISFGQFNPIFFAQNPCPPNRSDVDANAFITATGITDNTQKTAIYTLVSSLKCKNLWSKMRAVYPMVGGTATTHKFNLKNSADTDAAFRLIFNGGWAHSATGAKPDGIAGTSADTKLNFSTVLTVNTTHMAVYHRTVLPVSATGFHGTSGANDIFTLWPYTQSVGIISDQYVNFSGGRIIASAGVSSTGFMMGTKTSTASNGHSIYFNGVSVAVSATHTAANLPNTDLLFSRGGSTNEVSFFSIGSGLNATDALNYYNIVQAFQTALGRQI